MAYSTKLLPDYLLSSTGRQSVAHLYTTQLFLLGFDLESVSVQLCRGGPVGYSRYNNML